MNDSKELQMAKDFVELSILISEEREFIVPKYDESNLYHTVLKKAIKELKENGLITTTKLDKNKTAIKLKSENLADNVVKDDSLKKTLDNYNKLKAIKVKNKTKEKQQKII